MPLECDPGRRLPNRTITADRAVPPPLMRLLTRMLTSFLAIAALVYAGLLGLLWVAQDSLLFIGRGVPPISNGLEAHEVAIDRPDARLQAWFVDRPDARWTLVYFGGNGEEASRGLPRLLELGRHSFLVANPRGYGASTGQPAETALVADALAVLDWLWAQGRARPERTIVIGRSLGSAIAVQAAASREVAGVVLLKPMDSIAAVAATHYPYFPVRTLIRHPFDSAALAGRVTAPTLVFKAERDAIVPHQHTDALMAVWPTPARVITLYGTTHNAMLTPVFYASVNEWLNPLVPDGS